MIKGRLSRCEALGAGRPRLRDGPMGCLAGLLRVGEAPTTLAALLPTRPKRCDLS
ncbi:MAG TPA: hypothetical protein VF184_03465 [Phycisphaeraceae bacterium]